MARDERPPEAAPSVCWFSPLQLLRTGQQVAIATIFGRNADARIIEAITPVRDQDAEVAPVSRDAGDAARGAPAPFDDYSGEPAPFWFDYVADTGDGWDATATVAYHLARTTLPLRRGTGGDAITTRRGSLLIFGGDEVYPAAGFKAYEQRLLLPFRTMFPPRPDERDLKEPDEEREAPLRARPHVFAVPGNHDWYDSLVAFTRLFCTKQGFAGWHAAQRRSYFALKLPGGWWLLGTDLQLGSDIDAQQEAFFQTIAQEMREDDRVIVCHAEPHWLYETFYPDDYRYQSVHRLEARFGGRIKIHLAGDYHYYTRHAAADGRQKIVAGGGGAFLHLSVGPDDRRLRTRPDEAGASGQPVFRRQDRFPSARTSIGLALAGPLTFHARNPSFGVATAIAYAVTGTALTHPVPVPGAGAPGPLWTEVVGRLSVDPFSLFWAAIMCLGVVLFTDTHKSGYRWSAGLLHALCHLAAAALLARLSSSVLTGWLGDGTLRLPAATLATFVGGYVIGPLILSLYLTISILVFRRHREEASSALRCPDYKNFLRLRIDPGGDLTIYPIGITRVARRWTRAVGPDTRSGLMPVGGSDPHLIEDPVRYPATARP